MRPTQPPRFATWLLKRLGSAGKNESLIGDLVEQLQNGRSAAWYWRQAVGSILAATGRDVRDHKVLALRAIAVGIGSMWMFWVLASIPLRILWVLSNGGLYVAGHWITVDYSWMHYRAYLALLLTVVGSAGSGWIVARLHREHQTAMVFAFLVAVVVAGAVQLAVQVRLVGWPIRPLMQSALAVGVLFLVAPMSILIGGLWTDYGTSTTGARQNATF
jgi:hypothetical protein